MVQKSKKLPPAAKAAAAAAPAEPKRRGRPRAYQPEVALAKALDLFRKRWICRDLARRSQRRHRHEPAEPLRRVRRQARALHQELSALSRRCARGDGRIFSATNCRCASGCERIYAIALDIYLVRRIRPARLLHRDDGGVRSGGRSRHPRHGAARVCRTRQGVCRLLPARRRRGANYPTAPIRSCSAQLASATIHTIAIRARARVPRKELEAIVNGAIDVMVETTSTVTTSSGEGGDDDELWVSRGRRLRLGRGLISA